MYYYLSIRVLYLHSVARKAINLELLSRMKQAASTRYQQGFFPWTVC